LLTTRAQLRASALSIFARRYISEKSAWGRGQVNLL